MNRIKFLREEKGVYQKDLAKLLGVTTPVINYYENEKRALSTKSASILADYFGVSLDYLMGNSNFRTVKEELNDYFIKKNDVIVQNAMNDCLNKGRLSHLTKDEINSIIQIFHKDYVLGENKKNTLEDIYSYVKLNNFDELKTNQAEYLLIRILKDIVGNLKDYFCLQDLILKLENEETKSSQLCEVPIIGKIAAGQPILAEEYTEGTLPIDPNIYGLSTSEDLFYLLVSGDSMDKKVENGDYVLIHKQDYADNGDIIVAIVNDDDEATLKRYKIINEQFIQLEPMSNNPIHQTRTIDLKTTKFMIIGKAIGKFGKF